MKVRTGKCWTVLFLTLVTSVTPIQELVARDSTGNVESLVRPSGQVEISDVELVAGGVLAGQVIDINGQPLGGQVIVVEQSGREPISTRSDQDGRFRLAGLNAGLCRIAYGETLSAWRCWSPSTAPPAATKEVLLIPSERIERGQRCIADLLTGPVLIGLIAAAAVIIPIAVHNSQKDAS
jgi:hypothetical protein